LSPAVKYTLGRVGLFLAFALVLWPLEMNVLVKLMIAVLASAGVAYFLLRGWRDQMAEQIAAASARRRAERERLRAALAGEDRDREPGDVPPDSTEKPDDGTPR
jgi:hypothetical protein